MVKNRPYRCQKAALLVTTAPGSSLTPGYYRVEAQVGDSHDVGTGRITYMIARIRRALRLRL